MRRIRTAISWEVGPRLVEFEPGGRVRAGDGEALLKRNANARAFHEAEALRGGWSVRQLDRQIGAQSYERASLSRRKAAMLAKGQLSRGTAAVTAEKEVRAVPGGGVAGLSVGRRPIIISDPRRCGRVRRARAAPPRRSSAAAVP
jgi:hypothetical protein